MCPRSQGRVVGRSFTTALAVGASMVGLGSLAVPAAATFPGQNGKIASTKLSCAGSGCTGDIYTINPDGSAETKLTSFGDTRYQAWSPDGQTLAFSHDLGIWVMNADGTDAHPILDWNLDVGRMSWSPDGTKLVAALQVCEDAECRYDLHTLNADGTGVTDITPDLLDQRDPTWSPDGSKIAFGTQTDGTQKVVTINPDGTGETVLTALNDYWASWSPDATKIAFTSSRDPARDDIYSMNADGTDQTRLTTHPGTGEFSTEPAWSPDDLEIVFQGNRDIGCCELLKIPATGSGSGGTSIATGIFVGPDWGTFAGTPPPGVAGAYARPKGATPLRASLVPAYSGCTSPNRMHGPPLAFPSCAFPAQTSSELTIGSPDANGQAANSVASLRLDAVVGNPSTPADEADVTADLSVTDVYNRGVHVSDYGGELQVLLTLRITDRDNPASSAGFGATMQDVPLSFAARCAPTRPPPQTGASCAVSTTLDAVVPGVVKEGKRAIWELGQVEVRDGGPDDTAATEPNSRFLVQGVFVP